MTGSGWLCLCSSRCHHEGVDATVGSREVYPSSKGFFASAQNDSLAGIISDTLPLVILKGANATEGSPKAPLS